MTKAWEFKTQEDYEAMVRFSEICRKYGFKLTRQVEFKPKRKRRLPDGETGRRDTDVPEQLTPASKENF